MDAARPGESSRQPLPLEGPTYGSVPDSVLEEGREGAGPAPGPGPEGRQRAGSSTVSDLPDLTERLSQAGILGEYHLYRQGYRQRHQHFRRGISQGVVGEVTVSALVEAQEAYTFEAWYPTAYIFKWRFTTAYSIAILYLLGSLLFTFSSSISLFHAPWGEELQDWSRFVGAVCFSIAAYFSYQQLINLPTAEEGQVVYLVPDCGELGSRVQLSSLVGTLSYLLGALAFCVSTTAALVSDPGPAAQEWLVELFPVLGSCGFVIGGACEVLHNRMGRGGATAEEPVSWASTADLLGALLFLLCHALGLLLPERQRAVAAGVVVADVQDICLLIGSGLFICSSILRLVMWRVNDFGLTLLRQLNLAVKPSGHDQGGISLRPLEDAALDKADQQLSSRSVAFIVIYCWLAFVLLVNFECKHIWYKHAPVRHTLQHVLDIGMQVFFLCVIAIVLVLHSVVTQIPDEQPYYCAAICSRFVLLCGAILQTTLLLRFLYDARHRSGGHLS